MAITHTQTVSNLTVLNDGTDVVSQVEIKTVSVDDSDPTNLTQTNYDTFTVDSSCLLYTSPSPRDRGCSRMPSSA